MLQLGQTWPGMVMQVLAKLYCYIEILESKTGMIYLWRLLSSSTVVEGRDDGLYSEDEPQNTLVSNTKSGAGLAAKFTKEQDASTPKKT
jgi:hypothetical protein